MNAEFLVNGKSYPVVIIKDCFVIGLPEGFHPEARVEVVHYSLKRLSKFLNERCEVKK